MYRRSELCQEETSFASLSGKFLAEPIFSFPQLLGSLEGKRATMDQQQKQTIVTESIPTFLAASRDQELIALDVHRSLLTSLDRLNAAFDNIPSVAIAGRALPTWLHRERPICVHYEAATLFAGGLGEPKNESVSLSEYLRQSNSASFEGD